MIHHFDIIKHPFLGENDTSRYRRLSWSEDAVVGGYKNGD